MNSLDLIGREGRKEATGMVGRPQLLTLGNPKTQKGVESGFLTAILHLAPHTLSGRNVCPHATPGCIASCLNTAGRGGIFAKGSATNRIQSARIARTQWFRQDREGFLSRLAHEIGLHVKRSGRAGLVPVVRLNGTSDLPWETIAPELFDRFSAVQFYDYTKSIGRAWGALDGWAGSSDWPTNYHLTLSRSESNGRDCLRFLDTGGSVAVVWDHRDCQVWPKGMTGDRVGCARIDESGIVRSVSSILRDIPMGRFEGFQFIDGDATDLRFLDPQGTVALLSAKGRARRDNSGFVLRLGDRF